MEFFGRTEELNKLKELYGTDSYEGIIVYGRRQIGKSELLKKSFEECPYRCIYYECTKTTEETNADNLSDIIALTFNIPKPAFSNFADAVEYVAKKAAEETIVLAIDEYSYVRDAAAKIDSSLQRVIDSYKSVSRLKLILCGSYIDVMKGLLTESNPLSQDSFC